MAWIKLGALLLAFEILDTIAKGHNGCKDHNWTYHGHTHTCFRLFRHSYTWKRAKEYCDRFWGGPNYKSKGHLAKIDDDATNTFVKAVMTKAKSTYAWIGLNDKAKRGELRWDGFPDEDPKFLQLKDGHFPYTTYTYIQNDSWKRSFSSNRAFFICQHDSEIPKAKASCPAIRKKSKLSQPISCQFSFSNWERVMWRMNSIDVAECRKESGSCQVFQNGYSAMTQSENTTLRYSDVITQQQEVSSWHCSVYLKGDTLLDTATCKLEVYGPLTLCEGQEDNPGFVARFDEEFVLKLCAVAYPVDSSAKFYLQKKNGDTWSFTSQDKYSITYETSTHQTLKEVEIVFKRIESDDDGDFRVYYTRGNSTSFLYFHLSPKGPMTLCEGQEDNPGFVARFDEEFVVKLCAVAYPVDSSAKFYLQKKNGDTWSFTSQAKYSLTYDTSTHQTLKEVKIVFKRIESDDHGDFRVYYRRDSSTSFLYFHLSPKGPPQCPTNVTVLGKGHSEAAISWIPGANNGFPQKFVLTRYSNSSTNRNETYVQEEPVNHINGGALMFNLTDLQPSTEYFIKVEAWNELGFRKCPEVTMATITTLAQSHSDSDNSTTTVIGVGVYIGIAITITIIAVIVITVFIIRIRRKQKYRSLEKRSTANSGFSNQTATTSENVPLNERALPPVPLSPHVGVDSSAVNADGRSGRILVDKAESPYVEADVIEDHNTTGYPNQSTRTSDNIATKNQGDPFVPLSPDVCVDEAAEDSTYVDLLDCPHPNLYEKPDGILGGFLVDKAESPYVEGDVKKDNNTQEYANQGGSVAKPENVYDSMESNPYLEPGTLYVRFKPGKEPHAENGTGNENSSMP